MGVTFREKHDGLRKVCMLSCLIVGCLLLSSCAMTPERFKKAALWQSAQNDIEKLAKAQEPVSQPITLYTAMARAIKYNREYRLKLMTSALSMQQLELSRFDMLPDLALNAGYISRNNQLASSSESFETGQESLEPSVSQDKRRRTGDATFTWNVLDFGLSYVVSQQQGDRYLIAKEAERKTIHNIINDVRAAWWKALSAQRLLEQLPTLMTKVEYALDGSRQIEGQRLENPLKALSYQRALLNMLRSLENLRKELNEAKPRLAFLMGLPFEQVFTIADPGYQSTLPAIAWDVDTIEKIALLSRPELVEGHYQQRISQKDSKIALLSLLPNLNLDAGWSYDSNSYLTHDTWFNFGAQLSGSLLNLIKIPMTLRNAETGEKLSEQRRLVVSATVLMQVHLAKAAHIQSEHNFALEDQAFGVEDRILAQKRNEQTTEAGGEQSLIGQQLNHLLAQFRRDAAQAELKNNFGRLLWTMGVDPMPTEVNDTSVAGLAEVIKTNIQKWHKSTLSEVEEIDLYLPSVDNLTSANEKI